jgi:ABC-type polysaccharide/polyol phosphate transport system ATPase subunit
VSSDEVIVRVEKVAKSFRHRRAKPFLIRTLLRGLVGQSQKPTDLWPLREVSFEIKRGESVALVGRNGSGKSTLLRIIAGACFPTAGHIAVRGRIAPLLSVGVGFQPDMTGKECIEINATALGLSRQEILAAIDPIIEFAELTEFVDTPLRFYSSGMTARLGFSIAIHTRPDLLLIDEVLAVGDHEFQKKCMARLRKLQAEGVTILVVSHRADQVREVCDRVIWLHDGHILRDGAPGPVLDEYEGSGAAA